MIMFLSLRTSGDQNRLAESLGKASMDVALRLCLRRPKVSDMLDVLEQGEERRALRLARRMTTELTPQELELIRPATIRMTVSCFESFGFKEAETFIKLGRLKPEDYIAPLVERLKEKPEELYRAYVRVLINSNILQEKHLEELKSSFIKAIGIYAEKGWVYPITELMMLGKIKVGDLEELKRSFMIGAAVTAERGEGEDTAILMEIGRLTAKDMKPSWRSFIMGIEVSAGKGNADSAERLIKALGLQSGEYSEALVDGIISRDIDAETKKLVKLFRL